MSLKKILYIIVTLLVAIFATFLVFRGFLLDTAIGKVQKKLLEKYQLELQIGQSGFESLFRVSLENVILIPPDGDTLFYCKKTAVSFSALRFLKKQPPLNNFVIEDGFINLIDVNDSVSNYSFLLRSQQASVNVKTTGENKNYTRTIAKLWRTFFGLANFNFLIKQFHINWRHTTGSEHFSILEGSLKNTQLMIVSENILKDSKTTWNIVGTIDPNDEIIDMHVATTDTLAGSIPFLEKISGIQFSINAFGLSVYLNSEDQENLQFKIVAATISPTINHWRISPEDVMFDSIGVRLDILVNDTSIAIGPESAVIINQLPLRPLVSYSKNKLTQITGNLTTGSMSANAFFNSLPHGLFNTLEGIKVAGKVEYNLKFKVNINKPDSLLFESELKKSDFKIIEYGTENFTSINGSFTYTAREKDHIVRVFVVGPENPMYTPFESISPLLVNCVLTAEDGTFYFHKGFNEEAFRQSIATNIKEKRFARGGSTITMQLVKNVFLNRNKTISRKVEEALIVWLIENNRLVSKERILEVYLNIIEWGPGIYGIGEASRFYFSKIPAELSLEECIFLSSIIPRPKYFKYSFNKDGTLKEYLKNYFQLVAGRLQKKEIITQLELDMLQFQVQLNGPARDLVIPTDTIPVDSLLIEDPLELY